MPIVIGVLVLAVLALGSLFQVRETQVAMRTQFGEIRGMQYGPGLHLKWPLVDQVVKFEQRVVTQNYQGETFLTSENKGLIVDFYVKWRIKDVGHYYRTSGGIEEIAGSRLGEIVKDGIKSVVAKRTLQEIVVAERAAFTGDMFGRASESVKELGIELVDVRVNRIDLPD
jgi:membrane protease subunit HflC